MLRLLTTVLAIVLFLSSAGAQAEALHLVTGDNYRPYVDQSLPGGGLLAVLVRKVFAETGREIEIAYLPWRRAYRDTKIHGFTATFPYRHTEERAREMLYSAPLVVGRGVAVVRRSAGWTIATLTAGNPRVCRAGGYASFFDDLIRAGTAQLIEPTDINECLRMIAADRADVISLDELVFAATHALTSLEAPLDTLSLPSNEGGTLYLIVARDLPGGQRLIDDFNAALSRLRDDGWVAELFSSYMLALARR